VVGGGNPKKKKKRCKQEGIGLSYDVSLVKDLRKAEHPRFLESTINH
jgi:hypothetical protein